MHRSHAASFTEIILLDSAQCQENDAEYANRKGFSKHKPALPLYDGRDVQQTLKLFRRASPRDEWFSPAEPIWMRYHDAGHLLGSNMIEVEIRDRTPPLRILFSGDVGRYDGPLYHDPAPPPACDYLVCESTYGDRDHPDESILDGLAEVVHRAIAARRRDAGRRVCRRPGAAVDLPAAGARRPQAAFPTCRSISTARWPATPRTSIASIAKTTT